MSVELLAPAGSREGMVAAVQNGADAVYLGGTLFGARASAENFTDLAEAVRYCHLRDVRVYQTINTLLRDEEYPLLDAAIDAAAEAGVDAIIVQDIAVAQRIRERTPGLPLHASTQMAIVGRYGARWAREQGFARVIAARECTIHAIEEMAKEIQTEVFVHGALCSGYSGQCLMSSLIGGRSGNRGRCAQPCRLSYTLGQKKGYLLSARDLCLLDDIPSLVQAGVSSLKIEGRLRRPEYAALATAAYRRALDAALEGRVWDSCADQADLYAIFNRGAFTRGYAFGMEEITQTERPNNSGVYVGRARDGGLELCADLRKGDSIEIRPWGKGFTVQRDMAKGRIEGFQAPAMGDLYRTNDGALLQRARESYGGERKRMAVDAKVWLIPGEPARLCLGGVEVFGETVQRAQKRPLMKEEVRRAIGKFDALPWTLRACEVECEGAFLPVSALNAMRRNAADKLAGRLLEQRRAYPRYSGVAHRFEETDRQPTIVRPRLVFQSVDPDRLNEAKKYAEALYYEPDDWRTGPLLKALAALPDGCLLVLPFWLEGGMLKEALALARDYVRGYVVGGPGQLALLRGEYVVADYTLHSMSGRVAGLWRTMGAVRATLSPELTLRQATAAVQGEAEMIVYGHLPLMTLRHCVHANGEKGPCERCGVKDQALVDRRSVGFALERVLAKDGCRTKVLNGHVLNGLPIVGDLRRTGVAHWRVLEEISALRAFRALLDGEQLDWEPDAPATRGHWYRGVE